MRAFIAIEIPDAVKSGIAAAQERLRGAGVDASWPRPAGIHLTLRFLGEITDERAQQIMAALNTALSGTGRFQVGGEGVGAFPNPREARVVWIGIAGDLPRLFALQAAVEQSLSILGIAAEERPFTPHLTLGRIRRIRRRDTWLKALEGLRDLKLPEFCVSAVSLMQSRLSPAGADYREVGNVALG